MASGCTTRIDNGGCRVTTLAFPYVNEGDLTPSSLRSRLDSILAAVSSATHAPELLIPIAVQVAVQKGTDWESFSEALRGNPQALPAIVGALSETRQLSPDRTATIALDAIDSSDPPITLYCRIPASHDEFRVLRSNLISWWRESFPEARRTILFVPLPSSPRNV